jgi:hypothetical protein
MHRLQSLCFEQLDSSCPRERAPNVLPTKGVYLVLVYLIGFYVVELKQFDNGNNIQRKVMISV